MINKEVFETKPEIKIKTNNPEMPEFISIKPMNPDFLGIQLYNYEKEEEVK